MIRINLLAPERATKKKGGAPGAGLPSAGALQSYLLLALFAGGAAVLSAGIFVAVATIARLPGPLGLTATALASTAVLIAAIALLRGGTAGVK
jgi:hypothetical protein